ncbi:MAG TPA: glycoside hydrolase family 27 protein [Terriglobales bacterium]|nr:glycoside hydrolase family 27 protein [Terriglobales bacterium]
MRSAVFSAFILVCISACAFAQTGIAPTPPMGWNSWDSFGRTITESEVRATAEVMAKELKRYGWQDVVIDEGWYIPNPKDDPKQYRFNLTEDGRFVPDPVRFPSSADGKGFKPLADYVHSLGLKLGIHILRGVPKQAADKNLPIAGSKLAAGDAADRQDLCPWNAYNYGAKDNEAGQAYYDSIFKLYASWDVDFVKVDCIADHPYKPAEIRMISEAIRKSGRPMVLSLSPGPTAIEHADEVAKYAQMWRTCDDFWDHWGKWQGHEWSQSLFDQFETAAKWAPHINTGRWPDSDMLPLGWLGPSPGAGEPRKSRFTQDEQRTMMTLWSVSRSPLMMGGNLLELDDWTRSLLTNAEVMGVDQRSQENRQALRDGDLVVWTARPVNGKGYYVAVFNIGDKELAVDRAWKDAGLPDGNYRVRDLWEKRNLGKTKKIEVKLRPHASVIWKAE